MTTAPAHQANRILAAGAELRAGLIIEREIGQGGMGTVYLAHDAVLERKVAVKVLHAAHGNREAIVREARAAAMVAHPHVAAVYAVGDSAGVPYVEMEWVAGGSLRDRLQHGPIAPSQAALWLAQTAAALDAAHANGVLHCDIKPENVLIKAGGGAAPVRLVDFGLARLLRQSQDRQATHGTAPYMAPELAISPPTVASDVFALAAVAVELLTGDPPDRPHWTAAPRLTADDLPPNVRALRPVLVRALHPDPEARHATAGAFTDELLAAMGASHLRDGRPRDAADDAASSHLVAMPLFTLAATREVLADLVAALLALLPPDSPRTLAIALGAEVPADVMDLLQARGVATVLAGRLELAGAADRAALLARCGPKLRRIVQTRAASALETTQRRTQANRDMASALYVAGGQLVDAARLAAESAAACRDAQLRRQHLQRVAAFCAAPAKPLPWLDALLAVVEWDMDCGHIRMARAALADAQGLAAEANLPADHPLQVRVLAATAWARAQSGAAQAALDMLSRLPSTLPDWPAVEARMVAVRMACWTATGQLDAAKALARRTAGGADGWRLWAAAAVVCSQAGDLALAERCAGLAGAAAAESGEELAVATATAAQCEVQWANRRFRRAEAMLDALQPTLAALGATSATAAAFSVRGRCRWHAGDALGAAEWLARADAVFDMLGDSAGQQAVRAQRQLVVAPAQSGG